MSQWDYRGVTPGMDLISGRHAVRVRQTHDTHTHRWLISEVRATPRLRLQTQYCSFTHAFSHKHTDCSCVWLTHTKLGPQIGDVSFLIYEAMAQVSGPWDPWDSARSGLFCSQPEIPPPPLLSSLDLHHTPFSTHASSLSHSHSLTSGH